MRTAPQGTVQCICIAATSAPKLKCTQQQQQQHQPMSHTRTGIKSKQGEIEDVDGNCDNLNNKIYKQTKPINQKQRKL
jgi:peptidoglycan hydrolase CwlO-like protein